MKTRCETKRSVETIDKNFDKKIVVQISAGGSLKFASISRNENRCCPLAGVMTFAKMRVGKANRSISNVVVSDTNKIQVGKVQKQILWIP